MQFLQNKAFIYVFEHKTYEYMMFRIWLFFYLNNILDHAREKNVLHSYCT